MCNPPEPLPGTAGEIVLRGKGGRADVLRHADVVTTAGYARPAPDALAALVRPVLRPEWDTTPET